MRNGAQSREAEAMIDEEGRSTLVPRTPIEMAAAVVMVGSFALGWGGILWIASVAIRHAFH